MPTDDSEKYVFWRGSDEDCRGSTSRENNSGDKFNFLLVQCTKKIFLQNNTFENWTRPAISFFLRILVDKASVLQSSNSIYNRTAKLLGYDFAADILVWMSLVLKNEFKFQLQLKQKYINVTPIMYVKILKKY